MTTITFDLRSEPAPERPQPAVVSRTARMLALAYFVERNVENGTFASHAAAAQALGVSRARMSQILNLLNLPAPIQEAILVGECGDSERKLRTVARVRWYAEETHRVETHDVDAT